MEQKVGSIIGKRSITLAVGDPRESSGLRLDAEFPFSCASVPLPFPVFGVTFQSRQKLRVIGRLIWFRRSWSHALHKSESSVLLVTYLYLDQRYPKIRSLFALSRTNSFCSHQGHNYPSNSHIHSTIRYRCRGEKVIRIRIHRQHSLIVIPGRPRDRGRL